MQFIVIIWRSYFLFSFIFLRQKKNTAIKYIGIKRELQDLVYYGKSIMKIYLTEI